MIGLLPAFFILFHFVVTLDDNELFPKRSTIRNNMDRDSLRANSIAATAEDEYGLFATKQVDLCLLFWET